MLILKPLWYLTCYSDLIEVSRLHRSIADTALSPADVNVTFFTFEFLEGFTPREDATVAAKACPPYPEQCVDRQQISMRDEMVSFSRRGDYGEKLNKLDLFIGVILIARC